MECMENHAIIQGYPRESHASCDGSAARARLRVYSGYVCKNLRCNAYDKMVKQCMLYVSMTTTPGFIFIYCIRRNNWQDYAVNMYLVWIIPFRGKKKNDGSQKKKT